MIIIFQKDLFGHRRQEHHSVYSDLFTRFFCFVGILSKKQQTSFFLKSALSIAVYRWKREAERKEERERDVFREVVRRAALVQMNIFVCGTQQKPKGLIIRREKENWDMRQPLFSYRNTAAREIKCNSHVGMS